jgi:hypothetical protein
LDSIHQALIALVQGGDVTAEGDGEDGGKALGGEDEDEEEGGKAHAADLSTYNMGLDADQLRAKRDHDIKHGMEKVGGY